MNSRREFIPVLRVIPRFHELAFKFLLVVTINLKNAS